MQHTAFLSFYRLRAAREQYFLLLSPPCGAGTIFSPFIASVRRGNNIFSFYRLRAARKQYFSPFIVTARRENDIFTILSSPRSAGTIFFFFYRRRAAREQYFSSFIVVARRGNDIFAILSSSRSAGTIFLRLAAIFYSKKRKWRYVIAGTHGRAFLQ